MSEPDYLQLPDSMHPMLRTEIAENEADWAENRANVGANDAELAEAKAARERAAYIAGLRQLADALDAHPEICLPTSDMKFSFFGSADARAQLAKVARALPCTWQKNVWDGQSGSSYIDLTGKLAGLTVQLSAYRDDVCTRRVTGTEEREVEEEIRPAETRKVVKQVEVVEWDCHPILGGGESNG